jgi:hypothetical protein
LSALQDGRGAWTTYQAAEDPERREPDEHDGPEYRADAASCRFFWNQKSAARITQASQGT